MVAVAVDQTWVKNFERVGVGRKSAGVAEGWVVEYCRCLSAG